MTEAKVEYKTKKLSLDLGSGNGNGFEGYDAQFQYGFPKALKNILERCLLQFITYDIGKLLEHFIPYVASKRFATKDGLQDFQPTNPVTDLIISLNLIAVTTSKKLVKVVMYLIPMEFYVS